MSLPKLSTSTMRTHSLQNESDYDPKNHTIFSSYSLNPFRSENNFHTPVNFVNSNTETITDQISNTRIQYTTLYTEAGLIRPVNLTNNGLSSNSQTNYAPITAGENQQITNSSRSGILDERKSIYRYTNIENLSTNDDHNRIRLTRNDQRFNIYPKPSSPEQSIFNHKEISKKSLSRKGRSSSEPPVKSIHHSRSNIHLSYDSQSSTIPLPTPIRSLTMVKNNQKLEKLHIDINTSQTTWEPAHDRRRSCDYQFDKDLYLQQKNHLNSSTNLNSPTLYGSSQGSMQDPQNFYPHKSTYSRYSDLKPPIESLTFGGSSENGSYDHISNFSSNGYDNRSNRDTTDHIIDNDLSRQQNRIDDDVSRQQQNRIEIDVSRQQNRLTLLTPVTIKQKFHIFKKPKQNFPTYLKAINALEEMKFNEAINLFTLVLEKYPQSYSVRCDRAYASYQIEDWDRAMDDLNHAITKKPKKARAYSLRGEVYRLISMYEKSLIDLNKSLKLQRSIFSLRSRAEVYVAIHRYDDALIDLNTALEIKPNNVFTIISRAKVYFLLGQYNNSLTDLNHAFDLDQINATTASTLSHRGEIYRIMGRNDLALMDLNASLQIDENILSLERRGNVYMAMGCDNNAIEDFERILKFNSQHFSAQKNIAYLLYKSKLYEKALKHLDIALQLKSDDFFLLKTRASIYQKTGRYNDAIDDYNFALYIYPNNIDLIRNRGENYRLIQDFDKSIKDFTRVLELDSKNIFTLTRRGEVYRMLRQGTKALRDLDEAIRIDPDNLMARESRGAMNRTLRRFEESLRDLDEAIYLNPNSVFALSNRGAVFYMLRRCNEALIDLKKALKIDPKYSFALETRGALYNVLERYDEALEDLNKVLELNPKNLWALTYRGESFIGLKREEEALQDLNKVLENLPDWEYPLSLRGAVYRTLNMNEKALLDLEHALNHTKDKAFNIDYETKALCNRGSVLAKLGNYDEALADFNKVLTRDPNNAFALNERGAVYEALGKKDKKIDVNNMLAIVSEN